MQIRKCTSTVKKLLVCCKLSRNRPSRLCFHNIAMIRTYTTHVYIPAVGLHKGGTVESISELF